MVMFCSTEREVYLIALVVNMSLVWFVCRVSVLVRNVEALPPTVLHVMQITSLKTTNVMTVPHWRAIVS